MMMAGVGGASVDDVVCVMPGKHVKVFGKAVHTLSRLSDDLYVEASPTRLALRTVSVCVCVCVSRQHAQLHIANCGNGSEIVDSTVGRLQTIIARGLSSVAARTHCHTSHQ